MIRRSVQIAVILLVLLSARFSFAQVRDDFKQMEDSLTFLSSKIRKAENDSIKLSLNKQFHETLYRTLLYTGSFDYPFDSLKTIAKLTSPDKRFRIYNWNLPKGDGTNIYFGFIQLNSRDNPDHAIFDLLDRSDSIPQPDLSILDDHTWYGSLYYKIILTTFDNQEFYTLLGWDGLSSQINQRVIEILTIDTSGHLHFGAKIFRNYGNDEECRLLFKYTSSASMVLKYDDQYLIKNKKWNSSKKQFQSDREKTSMIVCDELIPLDPQFEGQFEYYVPSSEVFNGFVFIDGKWNFYKNVDVRNKRN
jgi:hypothetical protein